MYETYKIVVSVKSVKGKCPQGFKKGDQFHIDSKTPGGMCIGAYNSISPAIYVLRFGGRFPWEKDKDVAYIACPDPKNQVTYKIKRIRKK